MGEVREQEVVNCGSVHRSHFLSVIAFSVKRNYCSADVCVLLDNNAMGCLLYTSDAADE